MTVADISGAFLHAVLEKPFFVTPPAVERLESEPGCFVKKGVSHKDTIIVVVHVLDNFFCVTRENVETQTCRVH